MDSLHRLLQYIWDEPCRTLQDTITRCSESIFILAPRPKKVFHIRRDAFRLLFYSTLSFYTLRCVIATLKETSYRRVFEAYCRVDYVLPIMFDIGMMSKYIALVTILVPSFAIYIDYLVHFTRYNYVWHLCGDVMIENPRHFFVLNPYFRPEIQLKKPRQSIQSLFRLGKLWNLPSNCRMKFALLKLHYYPNVPENIRARAILLHLFCNAISATVRILCGKDPSLSLQIGFSHSVL